MQKFATKKLKEKEKQKARAKPPVGR